MKNTISHGDKTPPNCISKDKASFLSRQVQIPILPAVNFERSQQLPIVVLRGKVVDTRLGISRSSRYDKLNPSSPRFDPTFPKPIRLGAASIGFIEHELNAWVRSREVAQRNANVAGGHAE